MVGRLSRNENYSYGMRNSMERWNSCIDTAEDIINGLKDRFKETTQNAAQWDKGINIKLRDREHEMNKTFMSNINFREWTELSKHQHLKI